MELQSPFPAPSSLAGLPGPWLPSPPSPACPPSVPSLSPLRPPCSPYSAIPHPHLQVYLGLGRTLSHAYPPSALVQYSLASASIHHPHLQINLCLGRTLHAVKLDKDAHRLLLLVPGGGHLMGGGSRYRFNLGRIKDAASRSPLDAAARPGRSVRVAAPPLALCPLAASPWEACPSKV